MDETAHRIAQSLTGKLIHPKKVQTVSAQLSGTKNLKSLAVKSLPDKKGQAVTGQLVSDVRSIGALL
jgi:hypothetical protein